jgi:hypothetical protein
MAKFIFKNAARAAVIVASSTATGTSPASMLTDIKTDVHRSVGTTVSYTLTFASAQTVGGVHMPWSNLSPAATIRVRGYSDAAGATQILDSGTILACPAPAIDLLGNWTAAQASSAYAYGGGAHARAWFNNISVRRLVIDVVDTGSLQGYIECGRIFVGPQWSPTETADYGAPITPDDSSTSYRDDGSNLRHYKSFKTRKASIDLSHLTPADRASVWGARVALGTTEPFIYSLYPGIADTSLERDNQGLFCFSTSAALNTPGFEAYATTFDMETV